MPRRSRNAPGPAAARRTGAHAPLRSLSGLLDFECAARWLSFQRAALELHKTPAAVSQQVKHLEDALGFALFARHPRRIAITDKGRELAATLSRVIGELNAKVSALQDSDAELVLRVSSTHSFAMKWLVPKLHRFTERYPQLDLRLDASDQAVALDGDACDVAVRYGQIAHGEADIAYRERLVVVYSPAIPGLGDRPQPLRALLRQPLLYEATPELWLRLLGIERIDSRRADFSRSYSHGGLLVQGAVAGLGVALAPYSLAHEDLVHGRLRRCDCAPLASAYGYRLLCSPDKRALTKVAWFTAWMRAELAAMQS
jgi:LysR family glycine cleavage system transcriptional activator